MVTNAVVRVLCKLLSPEDREAVEGDLAELHLTGVRAAGEVMGLLIRQQAALWADGRPWLVLALVLPTAIFLSFVSRWWADGSAIHMSGYVNAWTWMQFTIPGARHLLLEIAAQTLLEFLALAGWSWSIGFSVGSLSRRTAVVTLPIFFVVVLSATAATTTTARANIYNAAVFASAFYRWVFPALVKTTLVFFPAVLGLRHSARLQRRSLWRIVFLALAIAVLTGYTARGVEASMTFGRVRVP
jgi:hypothetical protein